MACMVFNLWAVHISEGVLSAPWWAGGILLMIVLAGIGAWRIRDEEIPRIALLTALFFVASLVQLPVGPTHAHLLLNGLLGVLLGWRAALAIPIGVFLQTVLFQQGNLSTLGINSCLMTIPAIGASYLFAWLRRVPGIRRPWLRSALVGVSVAAWVLSLAASVAMLLTRDWSQSIFEVALHPAVLIAGLVLAFAAAWLERRMDHSHDLALGLIVGELAVLGAVALNCFVLLQGGAEDWTYPALLEVLLHLPIAVIEGVLLGFTVGFLARVRPDMLGPEPGLRSQEPAGTGQKASVANSVIAGLTLLTLLTFPAEAAAHRLEGEYKLLPGGKVRVESWFDITGDSAEGARVRATGPTGQVVADGKTDDKGLFTFAVEKAETLRVIISAGAGHRKEFTIKDSELTPILAKSASVSTPPAVADDAGRDAPPSERRSSIAAQDVLVGVGFILAVAAFVISLRNAQAIRKLRS